MANMSYCRFENTLHDLRDCRDAMRDIAENEENDLSKDEQQAMKSLIDVCKEIAEAAEDPVFGITTHDDLTD